MLHSKQSSFQKINNDKTQRLYRDIEKLAVIDFPVLIVGETGSGKEVAARKIHGKSTRKALPFISVSCSGIFRNAQLNLFGQEAEATLGCSDGKIGILEQACGGTVFLDDIDCLSMEQQTSLLYFLQENRIVRSGGVEPVKLDVRIFAATQINLEQAVIKGQFNNMLYHRLNILTLYIPPLRERYQEIKPLAFEFFNEYTDRSFKHSYGFREEALNAMMAYMWPGNIRELRHRVQAAIVLADNKSITPEYLGFGENYISSYERGLETAYNETEKSLIQFALERPNRSLTQVAKILGVSKLVLDNLLIKHQINPKLVRL